MVNGSLFGRSFGKYKLGQLLGQGAMGDVYLAYQGDLERVVAFKILRDTGQANYRERFLREAKIAASLEHPHIVPVHDYGIEGEYHYIVMRRMSGGTLEEHLSANFLILESIDEFLRQIALALDYAHRRGVIHRDIKPSNILFDEDNGVYLADFGIARLMNGLTGLTTGGKLWGTPAFMAPELWKPDQSASPASDIYALGVLLYQVLTSKLPFDAASPYGFMMHHLYSTPAPLNTIRQDLPKSLQPVIDVALAKDPKQRFATAADFSRAFTKSIWLDPSSRLTTSNLLSSNLSDPSQASRKMDSSIAMPAGMRRTKYGTKVMVILVGLIAIIMGVLWLITQLQPPRPTVTPTFTATPTLTPSPPLTPSPVPTQPPITPPVVVVNSPVTPASTISSGVLTNAMDSVEWKYEWLVGDVYSICARAATFNVVLTVRNPNESITKRGDGQGTTNACIANYVVSISGDYAVLVSSYDHTSKGGISLEIVSYKGCGTENPVGRVEVSDSTNLHTRPTTFSQIPNSIASNECFIIVGRDARNNWWKIRTPDGRTGWIAMPLVEAVGDTESVPILSN